MQGLLDEVKLLEESPVAFCMRRTIALTATTKHLRALKELIYECNNAESHGDMILSQVSQQLCNTDLLLRLIKLLKSLEFEARKDVVQIFNNVLIRRLGSLTPTVDYVCSKPEILFQLMDSLNNPTITFYCGQMLRMCIRFEELNRIILHSKKFYDLFHMLDAPTFDVRGEILQVVNKLLVTHQPLIANFLEQNYNEFFDRYYEMLTSDNYVTRRMSVETLSAMLLKPSNIMSMKRYVSCATNLKVIMNMMRDNKCKHYVIELFHIFKLFVGNPSKPKEVLKILVLNQERLATMLRKIPTYLEITNVAIIDEMYYVSVLVESLKLEPEEAAA
ncbi:hypothetical protein ZHAS_00004482 [Anopheles sinensis]|uniref:Protein Mo25 n=1 Tax=Anopheles sinensis TaxID=74873 RepID=A0A084VH18_ANOSI|nr:hypothetical protein ZHAS_00004482 [Anopheles sinensis]